MFKSRLLTPGSAFVRPAALQSRRIAPTPPTISFAWGSVNCHHNCCPNLSTQCRAQSSSGGSSGLEPTPASHAPTTTAATPLGKAGSPLFAAVREKTLVEVQTLLSSDSGITKGVNDVDSKKLTALHYAAQRGDVAMVSLLLRSGADANEGSARTTPLHLAAANDQGELIDVLVRDGQADLAAVDLKKYTALHIAASKGHSKVVSALLRHGAYADAVTGEGQKTALHLAAANDHNEVIKMLFREGHADLNIRDANQHTALHEAAVLGQVNAVKQILKLGSKTKVIESKCQGFTALHLAAKNNRVSVIRLLVEDWEADLEVGDGEGCPPLHSACLEGHSAAVKELLRLGANAKAADSHGETSLHRASKFHHADIVQMLVDAGADLEAHDDKHFTALHYAAHRFWGNANILKVLLDLGANVDARTLRLHWTPLHVGAHTNLPEVIKLLVEEGKTNVNVVAKDGETPLHTAAEWNYIKPLKILVSLGANVAAKNSSGKTAQDVAEFRGHTHILQFLDEYTKSTKELLTNLTASAPCSVPPARGPQESAPHRSSVVVQEKKPREAGDQKKVSPAVDALPLREAVTSEVKPPAKKAEVRVKANLKAEVVRVKADRKKPRKSSSKKVASGKKVVSGKKGNKKKKA